MQAAGGDGGIRGVGAPRNVRNEDPRCAGALSVIVGEGPQEQSQAARQVVVAVGVADEYIVGIDAGEGVLDLCGHNGCGCQSEQGGAGGLVHVLPQDVVTEVRRSGRHSGRVPVGEGEPADRGGAGRIGGAQFEVAPPADAAVVQIGGGGIEGFLAGTRGRQVQ